MNLRQPAQELLTEIYRNYQETGELEWGLTYSEDVKEKHREIQTIHQLVLAGLVEEIAPALGFTLLKLTRNGIEYFEENNQP